MSEEWRDIKGYEGLYQVSNYGRVRSVSRIVTWKNNQLKTYKSRIMKIQQKNGYYTVSLYKDFNSKTIRVHRLVGEAFIPNPDNLPFINHIDENKLNNRVENLEWCTRQYNNNYGSRNHKISVARSKNELLKRIRKEIEQERDKVYQNRQGHDTYYADGLDTALDIIDKYTKGAEK